MNDHDFLEWMLHAAKTRQRVTQADVDRLRRLADWADAPVVPSWQGDINISETRSAVEAARKRLP